MSLLSIYCAVTRSRYCGSDSVILNSEDTVCGLLALTAS